ncbi:hypothetical protein RN001_004671 [Aquatica leii]|uniref:Uncharacterized protein n=1 Tax=Aquatica leii TaxID=1421715 RepID=A0AAN7PB10_9COLE|nr:hypothetical protein RN001_004671 [Aquatica leii]
MKKCINLLLLVTEITLVLGEHEKVTNKRSATHLNTHSGSSLNNYYTANGYANGYGSNNNILYANGYGTASHGKFGEYGLNNNYFSNHKTENNDLGNNIYHNGASFINSKLDDKTSFGVHAAENKEFFNSGLYNRQNILNSNQNHDFGNVYSLKNTANYGNLNGNYANKFGGYISGDSVGNVGNENLGYNSKTHTHSHHTITKKIFVPRPYPVTVTKQVPVPQPYPVEVPKPVPVHVQVKVPVEVPKPYPVTVTQKVPIYAEKPVYVTKNVPVEVPKPYPVYIPKPVPVEVKFPIPLKKCVRKSPVLRERNCTPRWKLPR